MDLSFSLTTIFPRTLQLLDRLESERLQRDFMQSWGMDQLHFFPMMLKENGKPQALIETADYEYQIYRLKYRDEGAQRKEGAHLMINPSCQFVRIQAAAASLQLPAGVYALWRDVKNEVKQKRLGVSEATLLDRLQEDLILLPQELSSADLAVLNELVDQGLVYFSGPTPFMISPKA